MNRIRRRRERCNERGCVAPVEGECKQCGVLLCVAALLRGELCDGCIAQENERLDRGDAQREQDELDAMFEDYGGES